MEPSQSMAGLNHFTSFSLPRSNQDQCPLFTKIPGEVRDKITNFALRLYDHIPFDKDTSYRRPEYYAEQKLDSALLQTCQRIYTESWFRPWASARHTFFLAWAGRKPDKELMTTSKMQTALDALYAAHGEVELQDVGVFAQLCSLEGGNQLSQILDLNHFCPLRFTVTIRHHDWWYWEDDARLNVSSTWASKCRFPQSLRELHISLESLERKKDQIDWIASKMVEEWNFYRKDDNDDVALVAKERDCFVSRWSGSSTWEMNRWVRDETRPETLGYYIKTVVFRPESGISRKKHPLRLEVPDRFQEIHDSCPYLHVTSLAAANVPPGISADEAKRIVLAREAEN